MKKFLTSAAIVAALASVASAAPYVLPSPAPGALIPYDNQPMWGLDAVYTIAGESHTPDMYGARLSFNLYTSGEDTVRHQFSLNATPQYGSEKFGDGEKGELTLIPLTAGYDLNLEITDDVLIYAGGKAGYAFSHSTAKAMGEKATDDDGGFTYSVGAGLKYQASDAIMLKAGYEFGRTYIGHGDSKFTYTGHSILVGAAVQF